MKSYILVAAALFAGAAHATVVPADNRVEQPDCALLQEDVQLSLSTGVVMAYNCPAAGNNITVAGCHTNGRTTSRTVERNTPVGCGVDADGDGAIDTQCTGTERVTTGGAVVYLAGTAGGQMNPQYPGAVCDEAGAAADDVAIP